MLFSSVEFVFLFLPISLALYFLCPRRGRNFMLLALSLIFYAWGEPKYIALMAATIIADYIFGLLISRFPKRKRLFLITAIALNLVSLGFFKYFAPISDFFGLGVAYIALPVGISFYTFQALSYVVDVYRGEEAQKSIISFGAYITMFPQLVAGPIVRYSDVKDRLEKRQTDITAAARGILRFLCGLSKKLLLANTAGGVWSYFSSLPEDRLSWFGAWLGIIFYAFQIYFDFSGYSDMAIGLGNILGFEFPENFNYPYTAVSIKDFWRRWHISLSSWFSEYVYIPLGGNRCSSARTLFNLLCVWLLTGIWHGAAWGFVLWGLYYFILLAAERLLLGGLLKRLPTFAARGYSLFFVLIGWVFFAKERAGAAFSYLSRMLNPSMPFDMELYELVRNLPLLIILALGSTELPKKAYIELVKTERRQFAFSLLGIAVFMLCISRMLGEAYDPFLYFRF